MSHTTENLTLEIDYWEGKSQEGGCPCCREKKQRTEEKAASMQVFLGVRAGFSRVTWDWSISVA